MKPYDYLIVGSGLFGCVFAREMLDAGKTVLVVEQRDAPGGNIRCRNIEGIDVHLYGAHIFHTKNRAVWEYVRRFVAMNRFTNAPLAEYRGEIYNLPFNMNTFRQMWGVTTPDQAKAVIASQREGITEPRNLEEQAIMLVGRDIYEKLVRGYTEKQWGRPCSELPAFIIKRLPVRFTYDNSYFSDPYQGIPAEGYNTLVARLLDGAEVVTGENYNLRRDYWNAQARRIVYTGTLDDFYDARFGRPDYRSLRFETEVLRDTDNAQGVAVKNFTDAAVPYTRIIEHKHFTGAKSPVTVLTREYPLSPAEGGEPYYPVNDEKNNLIYMRYAALAVKEPNVIFGGRLAEYRYMDMDGVVESALEAAARERSRWAQEG